YAPTDCRSQVQTLPYVRIDIALPLIGRRSFFNLYVALSRSRGSDDQLKYLDRKTKELQKNKWNEAMFR
ncbi:hypothetical protein BDQ12DRAFT_606226, partial [Crucibulum laeve]